MTFLSRWVVRAMAVLIALTAGAARAGEITGFSWFSGVASVAATTILPPVAPNNDDAVGLSPNEAFVTQKDYVAIGPVDLVFPVSNSGGVNEYAFKEGVFNNTTLNWSGYRVELGFGHGLSFTASPGGDGLDFDAPTYNSGFLFNPSPGFYFPTVTPGEDVIFATGGIMPYLGFAGHFRFSVDVPDGITEFTIRQTPVDVPEPGTVVLSGAGLIALVVPRLRVMGTLRRS